jgi:hypothetical protein
MRIGDFRGIYDYRLYTLRNIDGNEVMVQRNRSNTFWLFGVPNAVNSCANEVFIRVVGNAVSLFCCEINFSDTAVQTCSGNRRGLTYIIELDPNSLGNLVERIIAAPTPYQDIPMDVDPVAVASPDSQLPQSF